MSTMTSYESYVDNCVQVFNQRLKPMAYLSEFVNMAWWLQCFAFDVIGEITYSKRFGFLDKGEDVDELAHNLHQGLVYSTLVGIFNEFHNFAFKVVKLFATNSSQYLQDYAQSQWDQRKLEMSKAEEHGCGSSEEDENGPKDFMTKFMEAHAKDPDHFTKLNVLSGVNSNINAGSDTTSITLSDLLYNLLVTPHALQKLRSEIGEWESEGMLSSPVTFKEGQNMEYLQAVIKESFRLRPAVGMTLPRVVPEGGALIAGEIFPAGQVVGMNPYVAHHNTEVFGLDATVFRLERWLKTHTDEETLAKMEHSWIPFGAGTRTCLGRNVSMLEITKLVPQLVRKFDFEMSEDLTLEGWKTQN